MSFLIIFRPFSSSFWANFLCQKRGREEEKVLFLFYIILFSHPAAEPPELLYVLPEVLYVPQAVLPVESDSKGQLDDGVDDNSGDDGSDNRDSNRDSNFYNIFDN